MALKKPLGLETERDRDRDFATEKSHRHNDCCHWRNKRRERGTGIIDKLAPAKLFGMVNGAARLVKRPFGFHPISAKVRSMAPRRRRSTAVWPSSKLLLRLLHASHT